MDRTDCWTDCGSVRPVLRPLSRWKLTDGWIDARDGWIDARDGRTDGWHNGRMDGWMAPRPDSGLFNAILRWIPDGRGLFVTAVSGIGTDGQMLPGTDGR